MAIERAVEIVRRELRAAADPGKAGPMAAYLKTEMPFYGVQKPGRVRIARELTASCPPGTRDDYRDVVRALWNLEHREEKYLALAYARAFDRYVDAESIPLFRDLIVEGAWWDLVDEAAIKLVGRALAKDPATVTPIVASWVEDDDLWLRRTSIICQVGRADDVDDVLLSSACTANLDDPDFFIRKAIGWALRDHAKQEPDWVRRFCDEHRDRLSALSLREATKHL